MVVIQMPLLNEGTDVWRSVEVTPLYGAVYRVEGSQSYDEEWAYPPGTLVECKWKKFSDGEHKLIAAGPAPTTRSMLSDHYKRMAGLIAGALPFFLATQQLPRTFEGTPEPLPLLVTCAILGAVAVGLLVWLKPNAMAAKWTLYSTVGCSAMFAFMALIN